MNRETQMVKQYITRNQDASDEVIDLTMESLLDGDSAADLGAKLRNMTSEMFVPDNLPDLARDLIWQALNNVDWATLATEYMDANPMPDEDYEDEPQGLIATYGLTV